MAYSRTTWNDGTAPAITGARLNNMEVGIVDAHAHIARTDNPHGVTASQVGAFPKAGGSITGGMTTGANRWWIGQLEPKFGLDLMGSSIIGVDEIAFKSPANSNDLGLAFLKTGAPEDSASMSNYNIFRIDGAGVPWASGRRVILDGDGSIAVGAKGNVTEYQGTFYIQGGAHDQDTTGYVTIARRSTTTGNINTFRVYADKSYYFGDLIAQNMKIGNLSNPKDVYAKDTNVIRSTSAPSGGSDGDIWIQY